MKGVRTHPVTVHTDPRGELRPLEFGNPLDFLPARVFIISACPPDAVRACHALSARLALVALVGSAQIELDNGTERATRILAEGTDVLMLDAGVWLRLTRFSPDVQLMVLCAETFEAVRYFDAPQPDLLSVS